MVAPIGTYNNQVKIYNNSLNMKKSKKPKSMHLVFNQWGEGRTPCCDMEIPVMIVGEIEQGLKAFCEKCQVIILPSKKLLNLKK
jgi:hypothetical protein